MDRTTPMQRRILQFIEQTVEAKGYPPTVREIGEAVGLTSAASVHAQLRNLERLELLRRDPTKPRAMEVRRDNGSARRGRSVSVPLIGRISAGPAALADQEVEEYLALPASYAGEEDHFALRVAGQSMIGAGILDGDVVVVRRQESADEGDVVAALLEGPAEDEATVKRLRRDGERVMLVPENPTLQPFPLGDGRILGRVVAVLRKL